MNTRTAAHVEKDFLRYWRALNATCATLGKRPVDQGLARAAYNHCTAEAAARYVPGCGTLRTRRDG